MTTATNKLLPRPATLILEKEHGALTIWFNQPESRNALSAEMAEELSAVLDAVADDRSIRAVILRGRGGVFCAGGDIKSFKSSMQGEMNRAEVAAANRSFGYLMEKLNEQPQLVIVLVEGAAIGGGLGLACVSDVTITIASAKFRLSETSLGIPPAQIAPFVTERVGLTAARRVMLTGASFDGREAAALGIAHFCVEDADAMEEACRGVLRQLRDCAPGATAVTKAIIFEATRRARGDALDFAADSFADCMLGDEGREGVAAFVGKRKPNWAGEND